MDRFEHLGRRYEFADHSSPDVTVVSIDAKTARLHALGGTSQTVPTTLFLDAVREGALLEAAAAPFTNPRPSKVRTPWRVKTSPVAATKRATARPSIAARAR